MTGRVSGGRKLRRGVGLLGALLVVSALPATAHAADDSAITQLQGRGGYGRMPWGMSEGGDWVFLEGRNLDSLEEVDFDGHAGFLSERTTPTEAVVSTPPGVAGSVNVIARFADGTVQTLPRAFTYIDRLPHLDAVTPTQVANGVARDITLTGGTLGTATRASYTAVVNGVGQDQNLPLSDVTDSSVKVTLPALNPGSTRIYVSTEFGLASIVVPVTVPPRILSVTPGCLTTAGGPFTISGLDLNDTTRVTLDGVSAPFTSETLWSVDSRGRSYVNGADLTLTAPPRASSARVTIEVTTAHGSATAPNPLRLIGAPTIASVSPDPAFAESGALSISGTNLLSFTDRCMIGPPTIILGGQLVSLRAIEWDPAGTRVTITSHGRLAARSGIQISNAAGSAAVNLNTYGVPALVSGTPAEGSSAGGDSVTLTGTDLDRVTSVRFGTEPAEIVSRSAGSLVVTSPPSKVHGRSAGRVYVALSSAEQPNISTFTPFTYVDEPTIQSVTPDSGPISGTLVTLTGRHLDASTVELLGRGSVTLRAVSRSESSLTAQIPAGLSPGSYNIRVTNADGSITASGAYTVLDTAPKVTSISPVRGPRRGGTSLTIMGANLAAATRVAIGNAECTIQSSSDNVITCTTPSSSAAEPRALEITTPEGKAYAPQNFFYELALPRVMTASATELPWAGGSRVVLYGSDLGTVTAVRVGAAEAPILASTPTSIEIVTPSGASVGGSVNDRPPIRVTNDDGWTTSTLVHYVRTPPTVDSITPDNGRTEGGDVATLRGDHLEDVTSVLIGNGTAAEILGQGVTSLTVRMPRASRGPTVVVARNIHGASAPVAFTYADPKPSITEISPTTGSSDGGDSVTITGTHLDRVINVYFGSRWAPITSASATRLVVTTPFTTALGPNAVTVSDGMATISSPEPFVYTAPGPSLTRIGPSDASPGQIIAIYGTHLAAVTSVRLGTANAAIDSSTDSVIHVVVPQLTTTSDVDVTVTSPTGSDSLSRAFRLTAPAPSPSAKAPSASATAAFTTGPSPSESGAASSSRPATSRPSSSGASESTTSGPPGRDDRITVTSVFPATGPRSGGTQVTIKGSNLDTVTGVTMGDGRASIVSQSDSTLVISTPSAAGVFGVNIVLDWARGGVEAARFTYTE